MSNRTLLIVALALMAGGLLLGGIDLVAGGGSVPVENQQPFGPNGQQGPEGGFRPGQPGVGPETEPGEASRKRSPLPTIPRPTPKATPTP